MYTVFVYFSCIHDLCKGRYPKRWYYKGQMVHCATYWSARFLRAETVNRFFYILVSCFYCLHPIKCNIFWGCFVGYCWPPAALVKGSFLASRPIYQVGELWNCLMKGTNRLGSPAWLRKGWCRSSAAVARWAGSRTSILSRKPWSLGDTWKLRSKMNRDSYIWGHRKIRDFPDQSEK